VNVDFGSEAKDEDACGDEDAPNETYFEADLGGYISACFDVAGYDMVLLIKTVYCVLSNGYLISTINDNKLRHD